ncbi:MAG: chorismate synthase [Bacteroidaceae bacterium]|nr:chorismate synthase [Bacteroidaceae bacterium]
MNTFGNVLTLTTFGESHGVAVGGVIDGFPSGIDIDLNFIQNEVNRRRPGDILGATTRREDDQVQILSGVFEGKSLGTPIAFIIENKDHRSADYELFRDVFRPGHADYTYQVKYGIRDYRGGGRASARETVCRVVAGAFAKLVLKDLNIEIHAEVEDEEQLMQRIREAIADIDTCGGVVKCVIKGCPVGLGEPVYGKLHAALGEAMLSINAVKGFEYGEGFAAADMRGSEHNAARSGGILGGISNGEDINFRVAFKPIPSLGREMKCRHDVCAAPRAVPIVEAMAAIVILDYYLLNNREI